MNDENNLVIVAEDGRQFMFSIPYGAFHVLGRITPERPHEAWVPIETHLVPADVIERARELQSNLRIPND